LRIISFVRNYGTKWSHLAKLIEERTEHDLKNRFFGILARELSMPIRKIKKSINYRNIDLLENLMKTIQYLIDQKQFWQN